MQASSVPSKFPIVWGTNATSPQINTIPTSSSGLALGRASLQLGFPPACFQPPSSGGSWPFGGDFNGILQLITQWNQWQQAGGPLYYDPVFALNVGGYPSGAVIPSVALPGLLWFNQADNNQTNPDAGSASFTASISGTALNVSAVASGIIALGQIITGSGVPSGTVVTAFGTGTGGTGSYVVNNSASVSSESMTATGAANWIPLNRAHLYQNTNFYVSPSGSDTTGNGSSGNPWATLQHAWNWIAQYVDISGFTVTINLAAGSFSSGLSIADGLVGQASPIVFSGAGSGSTTLSCGSVSCFEAGFGANVEFADMTVQSSGTNALFVYSSGNIVVGSGVVFGASGTHAQALEGGNISFENNYTISGSVSTSHWFASQGGTISTSSNGVVVTLSGTPNMGFAFGTTATCGVINCAGVSFSGSATGAKFDCTLAGGINTATGNINLLPGSIAGTQTAPGWYA